MSSNPSAASPPRMRILIVGAGAVGQVYAYHLQRAGAHVGLLVRPGTAERFERPLTLYPRGLFRRPRRRATLRAAEVFTEPDELRRERWDQVWLCVPTPTLLTPGWFEPITSAASSALFVYLQPGLYVPSFLRSQVPEKQLVAGSIGLLAGYRPFRGEPTLEPGVAFSFPPFSPSRFSGVHATQVVRALKHGGCPARVDSDARFFLDATSAVILPLMAALERADWSLPQLRVSSILPVTLSAAREALALACSEHRRAIPRWRFLLSPGCMRPVVGLTAALAGPRIEPYLKAHFSKVRPQTDVMLNEYADAAAREGLSAQSLEALLSISRRS